MDNCCIIACIINTLRSPLSLESVGIVWLVWQMAERNYTSGRCIATVLPFSTNIQAKIDKYFLYSQQIFSIFSTNMLYILNKNILHSQQWLVGMTNGSGDKIYQGTIWATVLHFSLKNYFLYLSNIYFIFSTNTFNNCLVGVTNGSEDEIYQGAIQATEKMHLLRKSFSQKILNRKER